MPAGTSVNWYNVSLHPYCEDPNPIQRAIDDAAASPTGGTVYVPAGIYTLPATLIVPANQSPPPGGSIRTIAIVGDGPEATLIAQPGSSDILRILGDYTTIEGMTLQGPNPATNPTGGRGVVIGDASQLATINKVFLTRVDVRQTFSYCLHAVQGSPSRFTSIFCSYTDCRFSLNSHDAAVAIDGYNAGHYFRGCNIEQFRDHGLKVMSCEGVSYRDGAIEGPVTTQQQPGQPYVYGNRATDVTLDGVWFEENGNQQPYSPQWFIFLEDQCHNWTIVGCTFRRTMSLDSKVAAIGNAQYGPCKSVVLISPRLVVSQSGVIPTPHITVGNLESEAFLVGGTVSQGGALTDVRMTDASAKFMLFGGNRRLRLPRIPGPVLGNPQQFPDRTPGDVVFNSTTSKAQIWDGSVWRDLW